VRASLYFHQKNYYIARQFYCQREGQQTGRTGDFPDAES
jgi:hypothetical protein